MSNFILSSSIWAKAAIRQKELMDHGFGEVPLGLLATSIAFEDVSDEEYEANLLALFEPSETSND